MLSYRDIASMLGHAKYTTMWEQWQIAKGYIQPTREENARDYYSRKMQPMIVEALSERYGCRLVGPEVRIAHEHVSVQACPILEKGNLPVGDATHLFIKQISNEGWTANYGQSVEPYLIQDAIRASLVRHAFRAGQVAMFLIIGGGDRESFVTIPNSNEVDDAIAEVIGTFRKFVDDDVEPPPDYMHDRKALLAMAAASDRRLPAYDGDQDPEFIEKIKQYEEIKGRQSALERETRVLKKEREFLNGYIASRLRDHSRAHIGTKVITIDRIVRNVPARIDEYQQINIKG
jgi:predicted phage-related endonuclease